MITDLHLHPAWQHRIPVNIQMIFPNAQFIVPTRAPAVINSLKSENPVAWCNNCIVDSPIKLKCKHFDSLI